MGAQLAAPEPRLDGRKAVDAVQFDGLLDWGPDTPMRYRILADNPAELYAFARV